MYFFFEKKIFLSFLQKKTCLFNIRKTLTYRLYSQILNNKDKNMRDIKKILQISPLRHKIKLV